MQGGEYGGNFIYKFDGNTYVRIGYFVGELYTDSQNRMVSVGTGVYQYVINGETVSGGNGIQWFELSGDTIVYNEFVDAAENKEFNGVPYSEIGWLNYYDFGSYDDFVTLIDHLKLKPLPEFDASDIIKSIKALN
jgi:hypothetical protein